MVFITAKLLTRMIFLFNDFILADPILLSMVLTKALLATINLFILYSFLVFDVPWLILMGMWSMKNSSMLGATQEGE